MARNGIAVAGESAAGGARRLLHVIRPSTMRAAASIVLVVILWELVAQVIVKNPLFFASLTAVFKRTVELWQAHELQVHLWASFQEFVLGFFIASLVGILFGVLMASSVTIRDFFDPWVSMLYSTPIIALGPLFILWFGIGISSKVAVIFVVAIFPVLINTFAGLATTDPNLIEVARSFGSSATQIFTKVRFPAALPFIIAGLRLGVARGLVGVVVAELFGAKEGLGWLIMISAQTFDTAGLFVGVFILAASGVITVEIIKWCERQMAPWRFQESGE
ncbi:MAG: ABC transporter permease [Deltaproteobacteria bacterium]|nr:ABC transporter permease [Deltaproteobacteria bacterium]